MSGISEKDIKNRIRSMESTRQITRAMELVASSKLRRAQAQIQNSRPYFNTLRSTVEDILQSNRDFTSPYLKERSGNRVLYVVIAGDRGLAGGYNSNILKLVQSRMQGKETTVLPIGKKAIDFFRSRKIPVWRESNAHIGSDWCFSTARQLCAAYLSGEFDEVHLAYTNFVSALSQVTTTMNLLPLKPAQQKSSRSVPLYDPDNETVFTAIVPEYLGGILYGALCESRAAEASARRNAMNAATQNADEMIGYLSQKFNRARQSAITQEITEIVAGS